MADAGKGLREPRMIRALGLAQALKSDIPSTVAPGKVVSSATTDTFIYVCFARKGNDAHSWVMKPERLRTKPNGPP
jgi:hypothetical protein